MSTAPVTAHVSLAALRANAALVAARIAPARVIAVVKANGYGHGAAQSARAALQGGASIIATATVPEALELRAAGIDGPLICWLYDPRADLGEAVAAGIELGVSHPASLEQVLAAARATGRTAAVHLKLDTGLGRNGLPERDWLPLTDAVLDAPELELAGVFTHFANADWPNDAANDAQLADFIRGSEAVSARAAGQERPVLRHAANSPATLNRDDAWFDAVRLGLSLYGLSPFDDATAQDLGLRPALRLTSRVSNLKEVPAGHGASYGLSYRASEASVFALVPGGYGDGIARSASGRAEVSIRGRRYPVVGRIAMDQMVADVGPAGVAELARRRGGEGPAVGASPRDAPGVELGDEVTIIGDGNTGPSANEWAQWSGEINYEIVTRLSARVNRVYEDEE